MPLAMPLGLLISLLFGVMIWLLPIPLVLMAVLGIAAVATVMRRPVLGLLLFGFIGTFLPYSTVQIGIRTTVSEGLIMLTWVSYLLQGVFFQEQDKVPPMLRTERLLVALMLFSAFPFLVGQLTVVAEGNGPINWVRWLFNLSILFLVPRLLTDLKTLESLVIALLGGTLLLLLMSISIYVSKGSGTAIIPILGSLGYSGADTLNDSLQSFATRMGSPWMHPNVAGGALAMLLPLAFCFGMTRSGMARKLGLAVAVLGVVGLLLTGSRGALVSLLAVMLWMVRRRVPHLGRLLMGGITAGVVLLMFYPPLQERLMGLFADDDVSTAIRFLEYSHFPDAMATFPFGIGFKTDPPVLGYTQFGISNLWLNFIYKIGLPGMLLFIAVTVSWWKAVRPDTGRIVLTHENAIALGCMIGVLSALFSGLFDHYFSFTSVLAALFWLFVGISLHETRRLRASAANSRHHPAAPPELEASV
ncbi:O-antigen ligase family protein [Pseudomonas syringae]|uniref:O-antigen ligase family protein n=1 Tax=Pseudomonas syringae group TaxID=136849 RepID=UPI0001AF2E79|nr:MULTISPECIES: O-antigen ligase family protein [Pseudomonas syringae group]KPW39706.1 Membrane protein PslJ [Pseudomonas coronafaciens pv. atropurpurea]MCQ3016940.1 O-antigen ligase family protein [Pseudomonas tremae]QGL57574.1 O-antigen ligase domain-containing protein [Pseudomonas coronafaciens pv. oryzae str. 1_6]RMM32277.1 Membrane protein PslJ [Pseudomonas coronafaciens pv. oryzae]RMT56931.1 Membrane protein PslJ [Pseudomonas coronafaciens pv. atropurpurea]